MTAMGGIHWINALDMGTIIIVALMVTYIATCVMTLTWRRNRERFSGIGGFTGYFALTALGLSLVLFKGRIPALFTVVAANTLVMASAILRENIRAEDAAGRWGGEEFLILLPETELEDAVKAAGKLTEKFNAREKETRTLFGQPLSLSFGVAQIQSDVEETIREADVAMYQAKAEGKNRAAAFTPSLCLPV